MNRRTLLAGLAASVAVGVVGLAGPANAAMARPAAHMHKPAYSTVTLVHGIPGANGFPVDIYLKPLNKKGVRLIEDVTFGTLAEVQVPAGRYTVSIRPANAPGNSKPALRATVTFPSNANTAVVAHLTESGSPTASVFRNSLANPGAGKGRVTVRHLAKAPAVDVKAAGNTIVPGLTNPNEASLTVPAGTYPVSVVGAAGTPIAGAVAFSADLKVDARHHYIAYAIGDLGGGTFKVLLQALATR